MTVRAAILLGRLAFVVALGVAMAVVPPALPRLVASLALARMGRLHDAVGWLGAYLVAWLYASPLHYGGLVCASVAAASIAFLAVESRARALVDARWSCVAVLLAAACSLDALRVGGGMANVAFAAIALVLLERASLRASLLAAAVVVVWCNVDSSAIVAPALALVLAVGAILDRAGVRVVRQAWIAAGLLACATLVNPLGAAFSSRAFAEAHLAGASAAYAAWSPSDIAPHAYRIGLIGIVFLALAVGMRGISARDALLATSSFVLALANGSFVPIFGVVAAPIVVRAAARAFAHRSGTRGSDTRGAFVRSAATLATVTSVAFGSAFLARSSVIPLRGDEPYAAIDRLARLGTTQRVFCANLAWCDAAEANGLAVVADGRLAEGTQAERHAQVAIVGIDKTWRAEMRRAGVGVAIVGANSPLATLLAASHWKPFARTGNTVVLVAAGATR